MPSLVVHPQWHRKIRSCVCVASMLTASWVSFQRGLPCPLVLILGMEISKISAEIYTWSIVNQEVIKIWKSRACNELEVKLRKCLFYKSLDRKPVENGEVVLHYLVCMLGQWVVLQSFGTSGVGWAGQPIWRLYDKTSEEEWQAWYSNQSSSKNVAFRALY